MSITSQQLLQILPNAGQRAGVFAPVLNTAMQRYQIVGNKLTTAFIAQIGHESGQLRYVREIWGPTADKHGDEGREDLGNTVAGDGRRYYGRGLIQITHPELLEFPQHAAVAVAWFWKQNGLNDLADRDQFNIITRRINGGLNGLADRLELWDRAREVLA